jgi:glucose-1-phosphate thymidylyltransferase
LDANRLLLEDLEAVNHGVSEDSTVEGRVVIGKGSKIINSTVRGPVIIGENCVIEDTYIGPFTSIDSGTKVNHSEIDHSIILSDCEIFGIQRMHASLIGRGAKVRRSEQKPASNRFILGESSDVTLP